MRTTLTPDDYVVGYNFNIMIEDDFASLIELLGLKNNKPTRQSVGSILANCQTASVFKFATSKAYKLESMYNPFNFKRRSLIRLLYAFRDKGLIEVISGHKFGASSEVSKWFVTPELTEIAHSYSSAFFHDKLRRTALSKKGVKLKYKESETTIGWSEFSQKYSDFLMDHAIEHSDIQFGIKKNEGLIRIFSDFGDAKDSTGPKHGRFYGAWQTLPRKYNTKHMVEPRCTLTIDSQKVSEIDFVAIHPTILYAEMDRDIHDFMDDPYVVAKLKEVKGVKLTKRHFKQLTLCMLYTSCKRDAINACCGTDLFVGLEYGDIGIIVDAIYEKHKEIELFFYCGKEFASELMYKDAMVCESVLRKCYDQKIVALPVHDSFIVKAYQAVKLRKIMKDAFEEIYGVTPKLKTEVENGELK